MKIGNLVRYIREDSEHDKELGYYPPIGTIGRVIEIYEDDIRVKWEKDTTAGDGIWFCGTEDVELVPTVNGWLIAGMFDDFAKCPYCGQSNYPLFATTEWKFCPYCGEKVNYEEV